MPQRNRRGPVDPRLVSRARATRFFLGAGVAAGTATAVLIVIQAWLLARTISSFAVAAMMDGLAATLVLLVVVLAGRAALTWLTTWLAHRSAAAVKSQLRHDIMAATLTAPGGMSSASLITLMTQGLDGLDGYFSKYLPQLVLAVTVPLVVGASILFSDWGTAAIILVTVPLIPIFMALVGWTTEARVRRRYRYQTRLARHFADLVAGLPTLQVFGRAKAQAEGLRRTEDANRTETMGTLRVSFLSALVLELLSTLSVAIIAVTIGTRLVYSGIDFRTALFVLILAPEVYLPIRQVGVHYHDSADGIAAAEAAFAEIDKSRSTEESAGALRDRNPTSSGSFLRDPGEVGMGSLRSLRSGRLEGRISRLPEELTGEASQRLEGSQSRPPEDSVGALRDRNPTSSGSFLRDPGEVGIGSLRSLRSGRLEGPQSRSPEELACEASQRLEGPPPGAIIVTDLSHTYTDAPALLPTSFVLTPGEVVALSGPSGCGKSTLLAALLGLLVPTGGSITIDGANAADTPARTWRRRFAYVPQLPGLVSGTVADNVRLADPQASDDDVRLVLTEAGAPDLELGHRVGDEAEGLSAGECRRVGIARALLRIRRGADVLVLDEPTAGLDADSEAAVIESVRASGASAIVVSHRPAMLAAADRIIRVGVDS